MTVTTTTQTYTQLVEDRLSKYKNSAPAAALFYYNNGWDMGLRMEAPTIMKEFKDNVEFGRDPEGTLFFDDLGDLSNDPDDSNDTTSYNVFYNVVNNTDDQAVVIQFFDPNNSSTFFAEFVARDRTSSAQYLWSNRSGTWGVLTAGTASAYVEKKAKSTSTTLLVKPLGKKLTFDIPNGDNGTRIGAYGNLIFKKNSDFPAGTKSVVNYNDDRILIYPQNGTKDLTAVFIPIETTDSTPDSLGNFTFTTANPDGTWANL